MARPFRPLAICCIFLVAGNFSHAVNALAEDASQATSSPAPKLPPDLVKRIGEITDAVLAHHVDPPARQQMILSGVKALYRVAGHAMPPGLSRRVSAVASSEQLATLLIEVWPRSTAKSVDANHLEEALLEGLLAVIPGGANLMSAKESNVMEQFEGNRYVGVHISLGMNKEEDRPRIAEVTDGGPADRAGVKKGDLVEMIDGVATKGLALQKVVEHLRGQEGTYVTIKVRQPDESLVRTYTIRRGQHARSTVTGVRKQKTGDWDCILDASAPIAYLRIETISASTPHDLRKLAHQLESRGHYGVILDLRSLWETSLHPAVLLADALLPGGIIGQVQTSERDETYRADADAVFRGLPMAVLVDRSTGGTAEWLAAALQDNKRGVIVGSPTFGALANGFRGPVEGRSDIRSRISIGDGAWTMELATGYLKRGDGRRLGQDPGTRTSSNVVAARKPRDPNDTPTGVKPDFAVNVPAASVGGTIVPLPSRRDSNHESSLSTDPVVQQAVRHLRQSLQKTI